MQNPIAKQRALMALRAQAAQWIEAYKAELVARGLGFTPDDAAAVAASAASTPLPSAKIGPVMRLKVIWVAIKAIVARFPAEGLRDDEPRLAPVGGLSLPAYAVAASAIGWSTDPGLVSRVMDGIGASPTDWDVAVEGWTERLADDVVLATMYGQLFSQTGDLPLRRTGQ